MWQLQWDVYTRELIKYGNLSGKAGCRFSTREEIKRSGGGKPLLSVRTHDYKSVSSCHKCTNLCIMYNAHVIYVYISCYKYV